MKFDLKIAQQDLEASYQESLKQAAKTVTLKGFRKGKAPVKLVEEKLGKTQLQNQALESLIPKAYLDEVKARKLQPITHPEITPKSVEPAGDWIFEVEVIEKPEIKLNDYQKQLKGALAKSQIWTPDKGSPDQTEKTPADEDANIKVIFDTLLEATSVDLPELLVKRETDRMLSKLIEQINQLGLTITDYSASIGKSADQLRQEYRQTAQDNLKLEFVLQEIAADLNVNVADTEIDQLIQAVGEDATRQQLQTESGRLNLKLVLLKRKTLEKLEQLAKS